MTKEDVIQLKTELRSLTKKLRLEFEKKHCTKHKKFSKVFLTICEIENND